LYISPEDGPWGLKGKKENKKKGELKYWNFVAIDGVIRNQLDRCATGCNTQRISAVNIHCAYNIYRRKMMRVLEALYCDMWNCSTNDNVIWQRVTIVYGFTCGLF
jgi:hypothetical protein